MSFFSSVRSAVAGAFAGLYAGMHGGWSDAAHTGPDRSSYSVVMLDRDTREYADSWTRYHILRRVEWLFQSFGVIKEAVRGIARLSVGKGISLTLNTDDEEWNAEAERQWEQYARSPSRCDIVGLRNFYEIQMFAIQQRIKAGEFLAAFVTNPTWDGEPCLQVLDPLEVVTPTSLEMSPYCIDGVEMDSLHRRLRYWVRALDDSFTPYPASDFIHWFHADAANQARGVSDFAQALAPMQDARELIRLTTKTAKQNSALGLHIKRTAAVGKRGALDKLRTLNQRQNVAAGNAPGPATSTPSKDTDPAYERLVSGGAIIYTDESGDAKFLTPQSPSPLMEPFIRQVLIRDGLCATGCPSELLWDCSNMNSANMRGILAKGENLFSYLGDGCIGRLCDPTAVRFIQHRIKTGKLRLPRIRVQAPPGVGAPAAEEQWIEDTVNRWMEQLAWQLPARITIDNGRDAAAEIAQLDNNIETLSSIHDRRGRGWRGCVDQWFRECAYAARAAEKHGAQWALALWRRGAPGASAAGPQEKDEPAKDEPQQEKRAA